MVNHKLPVKETPGVHGLVQRAAHLMEPINQPVNRGIRDVLGTAAQVSVTVFMMRRLHAQASTTLHALETCALEIIIMETALETLELAVKEQPLART